MKKKTESYLNYLAIIAKAFLYFDYLFEAAYLYLLDLDTLVIFKDL